MNIGQSGYWPVYRICFALFFTSFQVLKRLQQKDGGRPERGGQERGDMENKEADQEFGSCPWVRDRFELPVGIVVGLYVLGFMVSGDGMNVNLSNSWKSDKRGRIWEWLA